MKKIILIFSTLIAMNVEAQIKYPSTEKVNQTDDYFGTTIKDEYRWLENDTSAATAAWVKAQNKVTNSYLDNIPFRKSVKESLTKMWNYTRFSGAFKKGEYYYYYQNDGLQNQAVLYRQKGLTSKPNVFLDPNKLSKDGTVALGDVSFSKSAKYVAYSTSASGSDWQEYTILDAATGKVLSDKIEYTKFGGLAWKGDEGFYYSGYDKPSNEDTKYSDKSEYQKIFWHKMGTPQSADKLVYQDKSDPLIYKGAGLTQDERFLILYLSKGTDGSEIKYLDLRNKTQKEFTTVLPGFKYNYSVIDNQGDKFLVYTNHGADNYHLVLVDPKKTDAKNWKIIIPEAKEKLDGLSLLGNYIFAEYLVDANSKISKFSIDGKFIENVKLPGIGTISGFGGERKDKECFYSFSSFNSPSSIYRYDVTKANSNLFLQPKMAFDASSIEVKQIKFKSKDGTMVPIFLVHKKGTDLSSGKNPILLYGYGGFNISLTPSFSIPYSYFIDQGGVYAMVNLRGGSEYGEAWHSAGMLEKKQNVFDDFIGAAEYLISSGVTNKEKIAIYGRSNGGLLIGACMTQRPDLFKVALPAVGVLDMLRYHKFTVGWGWAVEYGSSEQEKDFNYLIKYSPLHNLKPGTAYPATMVTTADHDDRVVPAHSFKFAARLQECHNGAQPVLIRIDEKAGHGAGKPTSKQIEEWTDVLSFTMYNLGMQVK
jgi:prolyl oligopeptidase